MLIYRFLIQEAFEQVEINAIASVCEAALKCRSSQMKTIRFAKLLRRSWT